MTEHNDRSLPAPGPLQSPILVRPRRAWEVNQRNALCAPVPASIEDRLVTMSRCLLVANKCAVSPATWPCRLPAKLAPVKPQPEPVESISAVTLLTVDMVEAVAFYQALGFHLLYGGHEAPFTSFRVGAGYLNLQLDTVGSPRRAVWGRIVLWVDDVDAMYQRRSCGRVRSGDLTCRRTVARALLPHPRPRRP